MSEIENHIKKLSKRRWSEVLNKWSENIPNIESEGQAPLYDLNEAYPKLEKIKISVGAKNYHYEDLPVIRKDVLREGLYFAHKAFHVCSSGNIHMDNGIISWSISSSYQSSLFAIKAILSLLGLTFPRINGNLWMDCFPENENLTQRQKQNKLRLLVHSEIKFCGSDSLGHEHFWKIFQRVIRTIEIDEGWPSNVISFLSNLDTQNFAKDRNSLHYNCKYWLIPDDIFIPVFDEDFGIRENLFETINEDDINKTDFQVILNYLLLGLLHKLIKDISSLSPVIDGELKLIYKTYSQGKHRRLLNSLPELNPIN